MPACLPGRVKVKVPGNLPRPNLKSIKNQKNGNEYDSNAKDR